MVDINNINLLSGSLKLELFKPDVRIATIIYPYISDSGSVTPSVQTPPIVNNFSPLAGGPLTKFQPISFDITDDLTFRRVLIRADYSSSMKSEVVFDGSSFLVNYLGVSNTTTAISGGFHYSILRDGGWPEGPKIVPYAIDVSGSENT